MKDGRNYYWKRKWRLSGKVRLIYFEVINCAGTMDELKYFF